MPPNLTGTATVVAIAAAGFVYDPLAMAVFLAGAFLLALLGRRLFPDGSNSEVDQATDRRGPRDRLRPDHGSDYDLLCHHWHGSEHDQIGRY